MALRGDSYGTVAEVLAFTRHLMDGETTFNSTTRPTLTETEKFIDRVSGVLNSAIEQAGLTSPITNSTAKLACDQWVVAQAVNLVEFTSLGVGFNSEDGQRTMTLSGLNKSAAMFVQDNALGWKRLGVGVGAPTHQGLTFTGLDVYSERVDPDDTTREQPKFRRGQFDNEDG